MPDQANIHEKTFSRHVKDRWMAVQQLSNHFSGLSNKAEAWQDLLRLTLDEDWEVRKIAAYVLKTVFGWVPDKVQVWQDLLRLTQDKYSGVRWIASEVLGAAFSDVPDKTQAWQDLLRLTENEDKIVQEIASEVLGAAFNYVPDKTQAWQDLLGLAQNENASLRWIAAEALKTAFSYVPDKTQAWQDLLGLTQNDDGNVRRIAAELLEMVFSYVPDKNQVWQDLLRLTQNEDGNVRKVPAKTVGLVFNYVPDKNQVWQDLLRLTQDPNWEIREIASETLGEAFDSIPDKIQACKDLLTLAQSEDTRVRMYAYHSLGRASVLKATEAENRDFLLRELNTAIDYFEKSSQERPWNNPSKFCLPFYRSYVAVTLQGAKEDVVQMYLAEAKEAVGGSRSKAELFEVVDNLSKALQESQMLENKSIEEMTDELNAYRWYCDKAAEHMAAAEDSAPGAVKLMRKCNPLLEEKIQTTITEIQKKARRICETTRGSGTDYEAPGAELQKAARCLSAGDPISIQKYSSRIVRQLKKFCRLLPEEDKKPVCDIVEDIEHEAEFPEKLHKIETALLCLSPLLEDRSLPSLVDVVILTVLPEEYGSICSRLSELRFPPDTGSIPNLYAWKFGKVFCGNYKAAYKVAVGMIGRAGTTQGALAAREAVQLWKPRYVFFSGIAGGLPNPNEIDAHPKLGDVVIADVIHGYEYGKMDKKIKPRGNWTYRTDQALLNGARAYALSDGWREHIKAVSPAECDPEVGSGEVASGDKVVDSPSNQFFKQVLKMWPKIKAVEMEGAGVASAIEQAQSLGISTGFIMIRGISDLPRAEGEGKGTKERDAWKIYASDAVAAFIVEWISDGLPIQPCYSDESQSN